MDELEIKNDSASDGAMEVAASESRIALTISEIRNLLWQFDWHIAPNLMAAIQWSPWQRQLQVIARTCQYKHRGSAS